MKKLRITLAVLLGLPALLIVAFILNGTVLCNGNTPLQGTVEPAPEITMDQDTVRIMTFNIAKCFVYTSGLHFASAKDVTLRLDKICNIVNNHNPDILFLSEAVTDAGPGSANQVLYIAAHTELRHWTFGENFSFGLPLFHVISGNAVLSKFPVRAKLNIDLHGRRPFYITKNNRRALACTVLLPQIELPVWAIHNDSFNLDNNLRQIRQLLAHPHTQNSVMAGDFNARPSAPSIVELTTKGSFAGITNGPCTFPSREPTRTIDFIFAPPDWKVIDHHVIINDVSDHRPVLTVFSMQDN